MCNLPMHIVTFSFRSSRDSLDDGRIPAKMEMVGAARAGAGELTFEQVAHLLTGQMRSDLDRLLQFDAGLGWPGWPGWSNRRWRRRRRR
jgi:hypothetical protein